MIIQTIQFPDPDICDVSELYYHDTEQTLDLDGYFNLFYIEKHRIYTALESVELCLKVKGYLHAVIMHGREETASVTLDSGRYEEITLPLDYGKDSGYREGVFWLRLYIDPQVPAGQRRISGHFEGKSSNYNDACVAIGICTFRREKYVLSNMHRMVSFFKEGSEASKHFHVFLVDNGKTLKDTEGFIDLIASSPIDLIENANTGGTGGFTRCMVEAIRRKEELGITNLLLLDDDASFDTELFIRLYGLLSVLKPEYGQIMIGGAVLREGIPYLQHAAGEYYRNFESHNDHYLMDLRKYDNCVIDYMTKPYTAKNSFCGWWCLCANMDLIKEEDLPLPLFVHGDDVQFGLKHSSKGVLFMNGISVWHQGFEMAFQGVKKYYNTRNFLITSAVYEKDKTWLDAEKWVIRQLFGMLLALRYTEVRLVYKGARDFLKGPKRLYAIDLEKFNTELIDYYKSGTQKKPLEELLGDKYPEFEKRFLSENRKKKLLKAGFHFEKKAGIIKKITLNGWLLPAKKKTAAYCNADSQWSLFRAGRVLLYEPEQKRGYYSERKWSEMFSAFSMVIKTSLLMMGNYRNVAKEWRKASGTGAGDL